MSIAMQRRKLLILENDRALRRDLEAVFSDLDVNGCETSEALATVRRTEPDAVLFDLGTAREPAVAAQSLELLRQILNISPDTKIIAMTEHDARELAVAAVGLGATDFYHKPLDAGVLSIVVRRALRIRELEEENWRLRERTGAMALDGILGVSDSMRSLCRAVEKVAPTSASVLLLGDSGTGKELLARAVHRLSGRSHKPFVAINCAAIPETLLESELFGYEKGAFTGAAKRTAGKLESAEGGTVFLDEIGEMPPYLQTKLLRVLQEREYRPIGSDRIVHVDFRLICATNVDLDAALRDGRLREDLYFRINTITLRVPPLRERTEDIPLLCDYFLDKFRQRYQKNVKTLAPSVYHLLIRNRWPGNVRELENAVERAVLVAKGSEIVVTDLPESIREESTASTDFVIPPHRTLAEIEKMAILQTLRRTNWNKQEAAQILGLYRPTLYSKMKKHDIRDAGKAARTSSAAGSPTPAG